MRGIKVRHSFVESGKRILVAFLVVAMVVGSVSGCGGSEGTGNMMGDSADGLSSDGSQSGVEAGKSWPADTPMGRYVEEAVELPNGIKLSGTGGSIHKLEDGSLVVMDYNGSMLVSRNSGKNWSESKQSWYKRIIEQGDYIMSAAIGRDNTAAIVWEEGMDDAELEKAQEEMRDHLIELDPELLIAKSDGTEMPVTLNLAEEDVWLHSVYISDTGGIFAGALGPNLYEVKEDGSSELFLTVDDGRPELVQFHDNMMFMDGWGYNSLLIYDMDTKEYVEDQVLEDFVKENYRNRDSYYGEYYDMFFMPGDDDIIYIAGEKGLYRHVLGGSVMELIIDGSLSSFGNPSYNVVDMEILDNNEFLVLFTGGKLARFVYNPDIPTVPVDKVKVYSLQENSTIRQTISQYQTANPAAYVEYEVGMEEGNSVTREDALKSLNTRIMAGEGPDVLVLDNMPVDSYIEKGLLKDISPILDGMSGENGLFTNVVDAFRKDGHVYTMPCEIQMPYILGRSKDVAQMKDLEGIAEAVESMRQSSPGENLVEIATEKGIMRMFSMVSAPAWKTETGEIDPAAITEFLTQTKRIYDAQMDGLSDRDIKDWQDTSDYYMEVMGKPIEDTDYIRTYAGDLYFMGNMRKFVMGSIVDEGEYSRQISILTTEGFEDCEIIPMRGQCDNVFWARTLIGINVASDNAEQAEDFLRTALGKENQMSLHDGMAVNKEALLAGFEQTKQQSKSNIYGCVSMSNNEGLYVVLELRVPQDEEVEALVKWIESAKTPYVEDMTFEEAVYEEGINYMQGMKSLTEAVEAIEKKMAIYFAE